MEASNQYHWSQKQETAYQTERASMIQNNYLTEQQMKEVEAQFDKEYILDALLCAPTSLEGLIGFIRQAECY